MEAADNINSKLTHSHGCRTTKQFLSIRGGQRPPIWQIDHKASQIKGLCVILVITAFSVSFSSHSHACLFDEGKSEQAM